MIENEERFRHLYVEAIREGELVAAACESYFDEVEEADWEDGSLGMLEMEARIDTLYKRKADKVRPVNKPTDDGCVQKGIENWKEVCLKKYHPKSFPYESEGLKFTQYFRPRISQFPVGERLTPERLESINIGFELRPAE